MTSSDAMSLDVAVVIDVLEQLLARQLLAAPDHRREPAVAQTDLVRLPGLAAEPEPDGGALDAGVAVAQGRQAERAVQPRVLVVADPDEGQLEQPHDGREDLLAREPAPGQVLVASRAGSRQRAGEREHPVELVGSAPSCQRSW